MSPLKSLILLSLFCIILSKSCEEYCGPDGCNCYKVFNIEKTAPFTEIKQTYRTLSLKHHPDVSTEEDANAKFAEIADCYEVLRDEKERAQYNQCLDYVKTDSSSYQGSQYENFGQRQRARYQNFYQQRYQQRARYYQDFYQQHNQYNDYQQNTQHDDFRQNPQDNFYSNWSAIIPIITIILKIYFRGNQEQAARAQARPMTAEDGKKMLIGYGIFAVFVIVFLVVFLKYPFVLGYIFQGYIYAYEACGESVWNLLVVIFLCVYLVIKLISVLSSFLGKRSTDNYFKNFFPDMRKKIEGYQQRIVQEINVKRQDNSNENHEGYWNRLVGRHLKTCKYYRDLVDEAERDMKSRERERQVSQEKLKGELQRMKYDIETKMASNWQLDD